jgi:SHS2 domain-containing protein
MLRYRQIAHTADIGIEAFGKDLGEAFSNAAYGMFAIMTDVKKIREAESREFELREKDLEGLLFAFLNRLIRSFDVEHLLFRRCEVKLAGASLKATCYGERFDPARHEIKTGIKGATYHSLEVDRESSRIRVIFDV